MQAILNRELATDFSGLELVEVERPKPKKGELLVRVQCVGVNPADLLLIGGGYIVSKPAPFIPGLLGVGEVVENNAGLMGAYFKNKRVWFSPGTDREGAYAEYAITDTQGCLPIGDDLSDAQAVNIGNAVTALGMVEVSKAEGSRGIVLNAAAGNLGRLTNLAAKKQGLAVINIVRSARHAEVLKSIGAEHILDENNPAYVETLGKRSQELGARAFFDSVSGPASQQIMEALPDESIAWAIGNLSSQPISIDPMRFFGARGQQIRGFEVLKWLGPKSLPSKLRVFRKAQQLIAEDPSSGLVQREVSLQEAVDQMAEIGLNTTAGKTLVYPNR